MDDKTNQSLDGMMGGEPNQASSNPSQSLDGFNAPANSQHDTQSGDFSAHDDNFQPEEDHNGSLQAPVQSNGGGSSGKGLKVLLTLFIILFVAAAAGAAYYFMQYNDLKNKPVVATATVDSTKLQEQNNSLTYDNKSLTTDKKTLTVKVTSLTDVANQLKKKCGSSCSAIVIP